jgi:hypothetical protein
VLQVASLVRSTTHYILAATPAELGRQIHPHQEQHLVYNASSKVGWGCGMYRRVPKLASGDVMQQLKAPAKLILTRPESSFVSAIEPIAEWLRPSCVLSTGQVWPEQHYVGCTAGWCVLCNGCWRTDVYVGHPCQSNQLPSPHPAPAGPRQQQNNIWQDKHIVQPALTVAQCSLASILCSCCTGHGWQFGCVPTIFLQLTTKACHH